MRHTSSGFEASSCALRSNRSLRPETLEGWVIFPLRHQCSNQPGKGRPTTEPPQQGTEIHACIFFANIHVQHPGSIHAGAQWREDSRPSLHSRRFARGACGKMWQAHPCDGLRLLPRIPANRIARAALLCRRRVRVRIHRLGPGAHHHLRVRRDGPRKPPE